MDRAASNSNAPRRPPSPHPDPFRSRCQRGCGPRLNSETVFYWTTCVDDAGPWHQPSGPFRCRAARRAGFTDLARWTLRPHARGAQDIGGRVEMSAARSRIVRAREQAHGAPPCVLSTTTSPLREPRCCLNYRAFRPLPRQQRRSHAIATHRRSSKLAWGPAPVAASPHHERIARAGVLMTSAIVTPKPSTHRRIRSAAARSRYARPSSHRSPPRGSLGLYSTLAHRTCSTRAKRSPTRKDSRIFVAVDVLHRRPEIEAPRRALGALPHPRSRSCK